MKSVLLTFLFILTYTPIAVASPVELVFSANQAGQHITLDQNTVAVIELDSNPSTGYRWQVKQPLEHFRIIGRTFKSSRSGLLGSPGIEKIYVVGTVRGNSELVLEYQRKYRRVIANTLQYKINTVARFTESFSVPGQPQTTQQSNAEFRSENQSTSGSGLPTVFNWCDENGCPPIRDQGDCGSCWAFATVAPLESLIKREHGVDVDLSEQYLVSCNQEGWGCNGGLWGHTYHEWKSIAEESEAGAVLEHNFQYHDGTGSCNPPYDKESRIESWEYVCGDFHCLPPTDDIKKAIYHHGPLSAAVCANSAMHDYEGGIFTGPGCNRLNHAVVLVGWDDTDSCWIMRNSWGTDWGESGYMRIRYGISHIGTGASYVTYSDTFIPVPEENRIKNGQPLSNLTAGRDKWLKYFIDVPQNASNLVIEISGGAGDADLHLQHDQIPNWNAYDCRPYAYGNDEICEIESPQDGRWYIGLLGFRAFSGVRLTATHQ